MEISEVRVKLIGNPTDRLKAFASVTLDGDFVIRDIKVIDGTDGVFVAMPSRKLAERCPKCKCKNHLRAKYCNECGASLEKNRLPRDKMGRVKLHADIAHPINTACRQQLQERIVEAYKTESELSIEPGYEPQSDVDEFDDDVEPTAHVDDSPQLVEETIEDEDDTDTDTEGETETESGGGYADLIAELRRDAADRRGSHGRGDRSEPTVRRDKHGKKELVKEEKAAVPDEPKAKPRPTPVRREPKPERSVAAQPAETIETDDFGAGIL